MPSVEPPLPQCLSLIGLGAGGKADLSLPKRKIGLGHGEIYGVVYVVHLVIDKDSQVNVDNSGTIEGYKQRRLLNYLMLNVANALQDMTFPSTVEITERHLQSWANVGFAADLELWGATATLGVLFENYREV